MCGTEAAAEKWIEVRTALRGFPKYTVLRRLSGRSARFFLTSGTARLAALAPVPPLWTWDPSPKPVCNGLLLWTLVIAETVIVKEVLRFGENLKTALRATSGRRRRF